MTDKHWYIVQAYSNFERKVADSIREQAKQRHLDHLFDEVMENIVARTLFLLDILRDLSERGQGQSRISLGAKDFRRFLEVHPVRDCRCRIPA